MATINGTCSLNRGYSFYANVYEISVDNVNNKSTIQYDVYVKNGSMRTQSSGWTYNAKVDGTNVYNQTNKTLDTTIVGTNKAVKVFSGTKEITHNEDGNKTITFSATLSRSYYSSYDPGLCNLSGSVVLSKTKRNSTVALSSSTFNIGDIIQATITKYVDTYYQDLYIVIGENEVLIESDVSGTIDIDTGLLANQIYQEIPNAMYYDSSFKLKTYDSNNVLVGTDTKSYRANVVDSEPTYNVAYEDTNSTTTAITHNNQKLIQNYSTLRVKITNASALHYATLDRVEVIINGATTTESISSSSLNINIGTLNLASNTTALIRLYDSRGFYSQSSLTLQMLEWKQPSAIITLNRKQNFYTETDIKVDANYSSLDGNNVITIQYRYKKTSDSIWGAWNNLSDNITTTFNIDNRYSWDVEVKVSDLLGNITYTGLYVEVGTPIAFIDKKRKSFAVGGIPQYDNSVEVNEVDISNTYDNNERPIGRWVDGTIVYRKVFDSVNVPSGNSGVLSKSDISNNLDKIIRIYGMVDQASGNIAPVPYYHNANDYHYMFWQPSSDTLQTRCGSNFGFGTARYFIEYTKSV